MYTDIYPSFSALFESFFSNWAGLVFLTLSPTPTGTVRTCVPKSHLRSWRNLHVLFSLSKVLAKPTCLRSWATYSHTHSHTDTQPHTHSHTHTQPRTHSHTATHTHSLSARQAGTFLCVGFCQQDGQNLHWPSGLCTIRCTVCYAFYCTYPNLQNYGVITIWEDRKLP